MKSYPVIVSCDWFSYSCSCEGGVIPELDSTYSDFTTASQFCAKESTENHPYYECSALMMQGRAPIAHIFYRCKRADHPFSCQVKVDNSRLYYAGWADSLTALIRALRWRVMFVNRIDVCGDFQFFANGRSPLLFAQDYLSAPTKSRPSFIRHSSNKVRAVATRFIKSVRFETLSWGTRDSAVQTNLYNKSLELREKCEKPWIRQRWIDGGLEMAEDGKEAHDVWRVEFSIDPARLMVLDKKSKSPIGSINLNHVYTPAALIELWEVLHPRYFTFHFLTKDAAASPDVRVRDLPIVTLFERSQCVSYQVKGLQYFRKSTRTDRLLLKRLGESLDSDNLTADEKSAIRRVTDMLLSRIRSGEDTASASNMQYDVIDDYLADCFRSLDCDDGTQSQRHDWRRRARMWSRMLMGSHDSDFEQFVDALQQLESLTGTETFESCLRFANYCAGGAMPDAVISDYIDCDVEETMLCQSLNSASHPVGDGSMEP